MVKYMNSVLLSIINELCDFEPKQVQDIQNQSLLWCDKANTLLLNWIYEFLP